MRDRVAFAIFFALLLGVASCLPSRAARVDETPFMPPLERAPLDTPLVVTGGFGEFRQGHFHAGLDLGTERRVGKPVYAPLSGWIERVRASGVGYGRSLYLHGDDGRLLVFGHLDAFEEPLASWVYSKQDSSGQYEQDLWPEAGRFPVKAGQRIAWSGQSGAGGPHLHFEIRHGDMAMNPRRAGLWIPESRRPMVSSVTLEPLDATSFVDGSWSPRTVSFRGARDTLTAFRSLRAIVNVREGSWEGVDRMVPWIVEVEFDGQHTACRFDSISWATDMPEAEYVYDIGQVTGDKGLEVWAPEGFRPRIIASDVAGSAEVGTIFVRPDDVPHTLRVTARDLDGNTATGEVVLRPDRNSFEESRRRRSQAAASWPISQTKDRSLPFPVRVQYSCLPRGGLRLTFTGVRARECTDIAVGNDAVFPAALIGSGKTRSVVLGADELPSTGRLLLRGKDGLGEWMSRGPELSFVATSKGGGMLGGLSWTIPPDGTFEPACFVAEKLGRLAVSGDLLPAGEAVALHPDEYTMRKPLVVRMSLDRVNVTPDLGLYRDGGDGWEFVRASLDSVGRFFEAETRHLGRFALFRDTKPPRIARARPPRVAPKASYSRWSLEATLTDGGSGVDTRATYFVVDDHRVPSEWDSEEKTLRYRPLAPPRRGSHRYTVVATDRAGNVARSAGTFVLD